MHQLMSTQDHNPDVSSFFNCSLFLQFFPLHFSSLVFLHFHQSSSDLLCLPAMFITRFYILFLFELLLLQSCVFQLAASSNNFTDQSALLALKSTIDFDPTSTILSGNWTKGTNICDWIGVTCGKRRHRVTALNLSYMDLQGSISPQVGNLSFLVTFDFQNNSFHGVLPHEIGRLSRLRILMLQFNQLEGQIPPSLRHCQNLQLLSLEGNKLSGGIPEELGMLHLHELNLGLNHLMGAIPSSLGNISNLQILGLHESGLTGSIPSSIFNLSSLVSIDLKKNNISGTLPLNICNHWPIIQRLELSFNNLIGQLSSKFLECKELMVLSLGYNMFDGEIPSEIGSLNKLKFLNLGGNNFASAIPAALGNMSRLQVVFIESNKLHGSIPSEIGNLSDLKELNLEMNELTGAIPQDIFNMSYIQMISLMDNALSGNIPTGSELQLPNLEMLFLASNHLTGNIPPYLLNLSSRLVHIDVAMNLLTGPIPTALGNLKHLQYLALQGNKFTGEPGNPELTFLSALSNCRSLETLVLHSNPLNGIIPESIQNFSSSLQTFYAPDCQIRGHIPLAIGSLKQLTLLELSSNKLTGNIPSKIGGLQRLQRFFLADNKIEGFIPEELCHLRQLGAIHLQNNKISGPIPDCIGNLTLLQKLSLSSNRLTSFIPENLWGLENLFAMDLSFNSFSGYLPSSIRRSIVLEYMDLSGNKITGTIPSIFGAFESLSSLNLSKNLFQGSIPESFGDLRTLDSMDISYNNISGTIPKSLEKLPLLKHLNLSFNRLTGEIPTRGPFVNFTAESFLGNKALCGRPIYGVPPCSSSPTWKSRMRHLLKFILPVVLAVIIFVALVYTLRRRQQIKVQLPSSEDIMLPEIEYRVISYQELCQATGNFSVSNYLGEGSSGYVYKGILSDQTIIAVKVVNLKHESALTSFDTECKVLRAIRHRNLVKVITVCSNADLRALVLQYMPNGSLEKWLHSQDCCLNLLQRVNILFDVASAMEYLHHSQLEPIVHCDLKPSNILLDEDMVAHVADFGIAKILNKDNPEVQTKTLGSLGYIAPEYGSEGKVSIKGDVYSYGILLLETITGKKPTNEMFHEDMTLIKWVTASFPDKIMEIVDGRLLVTIKAGANVTVAQSILWSTIELGLECTKELPETRICMKDVVVKVNKIKLTFIQNRNRGS